MSSEPAAARPTIALERWAAAVAALVVAAGVLALGWSSFTVVGLSWFENVVIGVFTIARMQAVGSLAGGGANRAGMLFLMAFFTVHFGLFCLAHGVFVVQLLDKPVQGLPNPFQHIVGRLLAEPLGWVAMMAVVLFIASDFARWLIDARQHQSKSNELMLAPYQRIVVLHLALLGGALLMQSLGVPQASVLMLVVLKLAFDLSEVRRPFTFAWRRTA